MINEPPNTRVQRTRSSASPPHSPLTRSPLGPAISIMATGRVVALILLATFIGASSQAESSRETVVRKVIKENLHFSIHCWCKAATDATVPGVLKSVSQRDIPVLVSLLGDKDGGVKAGASAVLVEFGNAALPALREAVSSHSKIMAEAQLTINAIDRGKLK